MCCREQSTTLPNERSARILVKISRSKRLRATGDTYTSRSPVFYFILREEEKKTTYKWNGLRAVSQLASDGSETGCQLLRRDDVSILWSGIWKHETRAGCYSIFFVIFQIVNFGSEINFCHFLFPSRTVRFKRKYYQLATRPKTARS